MTLSEAVFIRSSCRSYLADPISSDQRRQLWKAIKQVNHRSGLCVRLVCGRPDPFLPPAGGPLKGVRHYLVLAGPADLPDLEERCGYYGEELVLTAASMGLDTCWVGGTYDRSSCLCHLEQGEELVCVAAVGRGARTAPDRPNPSRAAPNLCQAPAQAPDWFAAGLACVHRAPSARNRRGYRFAYLEDGTAQARLAGAGSFALVDLGIAKLHFELGAHGGRWTWGDGGVFRKAAEEKSCGAVIWRPAGDGREYLLARHNGGHWSFPKGHVEGRETERETAAREIREETGLTADIDGGFRQVVTYSPAPGIVKDVVFFTATPAGGTERRQEEEIAQLGWFSFREARALVTFATGEEVLLAAEAYLNGKS